MEYIVDKTINSIRKRLLENGQIQLQMSEGYITEGTCKFYDPVDEKELNDFIKELGYQLPEDYKRFLQITNGCRLFDHPIYGGESYLYGLIEIPQQTYEEPNEGYLKIGCIYQDNIVIDLKAYSEGNLNYLLVKDHIEPFHDSRKLNMNFELWLDRFVVSQGSKFWDWPIYTAENYYRLK